MKHVYLVTFDSDEINGVDARNALREAFGSMTRFIAFPKDRLDYDAFVLPVGVDRLEPTEAHVMVLLPPNN